ncbi:MAG: dATP/dGTP diphosphohydrolase domain-containing protein [Cetobacterium sp.]
MEFKVGDQVLVTGTMYAQKFENIRGAIVGVSDFFIEVEFENWKLGHNGNSNDESITSRWFINTAYYKNVTVIPPRHTETADIHPLLPDMADERKRIPLASGLFDYFASALIEVAKISHIGNEQHNPGQPLHWARGKSTDHADTMLRHFAQRGTFDTDRVRHSAKMVWRALAILQMEMENDGYPKARGAR